MPPTVELADAVPARAAALVVAITPGTGDPAVAKLGRGAAGDIESFGAEPAALLAVLTREKTKGNVGDVGQLAGLARDDALASASIALFHPLKFMLASPAVDAAAIHARLGPQVLVEEQSDGTGAPLHTRGWAVRC